MAPLISVRKVSEANDLDEVHRIRKIVFVDEQHCPPELEWSHEDRSVHFLATCDGDPCGAARWRKTDAGFKLERFAVLKTYRGRGAGGALLHAVLNDLPKANELIYLHAQVDAVSFYERFHFIAVGEIFEQAGILHRKMLLPRVAFVTYAEHPDIAPDDRLLSEFLSTKHIHVTAAVWSDRRINWDQFHLIVIRSTWDYYHKPKEFDAWLKMMAEKKFPLMNPAPAIDWNKDKIYLKQLVGAGVNIPRFHYCERNGEYDLTSLLDSMKNEKAVVKPAMSGGAYNTYVASQPLSTAEDEKFLKMLRSGAVIVQEFVEEITTHGEISMIFFNRVFSHAVQKVAVPGDFRVQAKFGGVPRSVQVPKQLIDMYIELLNIVPWELLYARVDALQRADGSYTLMELELIEPVLFVEYDEASPERFFTAMMQIIKAVNK